MRKQELIYRDFNMGALRGHFILGYAPLFSEISAKLIPPRRRISPIRQGEAGISVQLFSVYLHLYLVWQ